MSKHSIDDLKRFHNQAQQFFEAELTLLKEVLPKIVDDRLRKCSVLLSSSLQTGAALLQLTNKIDYFTSESVMLARAFIEKTANFCYASICDEKEYRAFILHPIYKNYHNVRITIREDDLDNISKIRDERKEKQEKLKKYDIVKEALTIFSEKNPNLNWTKKTLNQRIDVIREKGKILDVFFSMSKFQYYSDASEILHGSLYGCTYNFGIFDPDFDNNRMEELDKRLYKDSTCMLLDLGMLIHESFTIISYSTKIDEIWEHSYNNRGLALNLKFHVLGKKVNNNASL